MDISWYTHWLAFFREYGALGIAWKYPGMSGITLRMDRTYRMHENQINHCFINSSRPILGILKEKATLCRQIKSRKITKL